MDFNSTKLPYIIFKIIRRFVGERFPELKQCLISHVYPNADTLFRDVYGIPNYDVDGSIAWTVMPLETEYNDNTIVAIGAFEFVRTIPIIAQDGDFKRKTFVFRAPSKRFWTFNQFMRFVCECESELRLEHNIYLGHIYCDGLDIEVINQISRIYPYIH